MDDCKTHSGAVERAQIDLQRWVESHLPELRRVGDRSTLWFGTMQKCVNLVEALVRATVERLLPTVPSSDELVRQVGRGKPLNKFTLGQFIGLLQSVEDPLLVVVAQQNHFADLKRPLIGKDGIRLMDRLSRLRNDFAHNHWPREQSNSLTLEFLKSARELAHLPIISLAARIEDEAA